MWFQSDTIEYNSAVCMRYSSTVFNNIEMVQWRAAGWVKQEYGTTTIL